MPQSSVSAPVASNWPSPSCDCLAHRFGNAVDRPDRRPVYPSDMSGQEWAVVRDAMPVPGWLEGRGGQPEGYCHRQMIDAVRYLNDNGCKWRAMPVDFPAWDRVYAFNRRWRIKGLLSELHDRLRGLLREDAGRDPEPSAGIVDSQTVRASAHVPKASSGYDAGKKTPGRKRHVLVDCLGLLLGVMVTAASVQDRERRPPTAGTRTGPLPPPRPGLGGRRLRRKTRALGRRATAPEAADHQTVRRRVRLRGTAAPVDGRTHPELADAHPPPGTGLRGAAGSPRADGGLVDDHAHDPAAGPSAILNRPRTGSTSQPRSTSRFATCRTRPSTLFFVNSIPNATAISGHERVAACPPERAADASTSTTAR